VIIMSADNEMLKDGKIEYRINEGVTSFNVGMATPLAPDVFVTGENFEFYIYDSTLDEPFVAIKGMVEKVSRDCKDNSRIYGINGRDMGRLLTTQPFSLPCTAELGQQHTVEELLELIFVDTSITFGRGQTPLSKRVVLNTSENSASRFCGSWNTKVEAINQLFSQYCKISGAKSIRWYINYAGYFRWFETRTERAGKVFIFEDDDRILDFKVEEDATSIVNRITGTYGDEENQQSVTRTNTASKNRFGLCIGNDVNEQHYTLEQMTAELDKQLEMKADPIYSGTVTFFGLVPYETGTQIMFPNDDYHSQIVFTAVDYTINVVNGTAMTTVNITSDESSISIVNEFDVIEATAQQVVNDNMLRVGVVTSIPNKNDDRCLVSRPSKTGYAQINARNPGGQWR
jgi:hypothetical protein